MNVEGAASVPEWQLALEHAHDLMARAARALSYEAEPVIDLVPLARSLERAFERIYAAYDLRDEPIGAAHAADLEVAGVAEKLAPVASLDAALGKAHRFLGAARGELATAQELLGRRILSVQPPPAEMRASVRMPMLHAIARGSLVPSIRVPDAKADPVETAPPLPKPRSIAETEHKLAELKRRAEERRKASLARREARKRARLEQPKEPAAPPAPGFADEIPDAISEDTFLGQRTREMFEEVVMVGSQRLPLGVEPWRSVVVFETRLLNALDAIASMGPAAIGRIEPMAIDAPTKDPSRAFGVGFVLGCVEGRDALAAAERVLYHYGNDPELTARFGAALKLVPHPSLPVAMRTFLADPEPAYRAMAVEVLFHRRLISPQELSVAASDSAPMVRQLALPRLALALGPGLSEAIESALAAPDRGVREAAWLAMALSGHPHASSILAQELTSENGDDAALALALVAESHDAQRLVELVSESPTVGRITALGWAGPREAVPVLIKLLYVEDKALRLAAAHALDRITGARLVEEVEVLPEEILAADIPMPAGLEPPKPKPLAELVSDPRDQPGKGAPEKITRPSMQASRWAAWWGEAQGKWTKEARYRRGHPYTAVVSLWELDAFALTVGERRFLAHELVVRTGHHVPFDVDDFVHVQEESLRAWEPLARQASGYPGDWVRSMRRS